MCRRDEHVARVQLVPELRAQQGARHCHEADGGQLPGAAGYARRVHYFRSVHAYLYMYKYSTPLSIQALIDITHS